MLNVKCKSYLVVFISIKHYIIQVVFAQYKINLQNITIESFQVKNRLIKILRAVFNQIASKISVRLKRILRKPKGSLGPKTTLTFISTTEYPNDCVIFFSEKG